MERKVSEAAPTDPTQQWDRNLTRYVLSRRVPTYFSHRILAHSILQPTTYPMYWRSQEMNSQRVSEYKIRMNKTLIIDEKNILRTTSQTCIVKVLVNHFETCFLWIGFGATLKGCGSRFELWTNAWLDQVKLHLQKILIFITLGKTTKRIYYW